MRRVLRRAWLVLLAAFVVLEVAGVGYGMTTGDWGGTLSGIAWGGVDAIAEVWPLAWVVWALALASIGLHLADIGPFGRGRR